MNIVLSNKGKQKLILNGYAYHLERSSQTYQWACTERKPLLCKGRVVTKIIEGTHIVKKGPSLHLHDPWAHEKSVIIANNNLKVAAKMTKLRPSQIIRESIVNCSTETRVYLPTNHAQNQKITRARRTSIKEPDNIENINVPDNLRQIEGEQFVLSVKQFKNEGVIVLATQSTLKLLSEAECWLMDGTFEVVPNCMRQLFSIHGRINGETVPLVFGLMTSKSKEAYFEFFYEMCKWACEWKINLNPKFVISDFEKASVAALKHFFPLTIYKGCLFHFGKIIWRKVQADGCVVKYGNEENFSLEIRMLKSLAFLPENQIITYYEELKKKFSSTAARKIGNWFKKNYLTGPKNKKTSVLPKPQYSPKYWSIWDNVHQNLPRTQNSVEGWHRRLQVLVGRPHIGVYKLIEELGKEIIVGKNRITQMRAGIPSQKKRKLQNKNIKIMNVIKQKNDLTKIEYLKNLAYNIDLSK